MFTGWGPTEKTPAANEQSIFINKQQRLSPPKTLCQHWMPNKTFQEHRAQENSAHGWIGGLAAVQLGASVQPPTRAQPGAASCCVRLFYSNQSCKWFQRLLLPVGRMHSLSIRSLLGSVHNPVSSTTRGHSSPWVDGYHGGGCYAHGEPILSPKNPMHLELCSEMDRWREIIALYYPEEQ